MKKNRKTFWQKTKNEWNKNMIVYLFLVPIFIHFVIFQFIPIGFSMVLTVTDWSVTGGSGFVGLKHWDAFFHDELAWKAIWNTILFSVYYIVPTMALGLLLAVLVHFNLFGSKVFKGIFFLPVVTSFVVVSGLWAWLFSGNEYGAVNSLLALIGIEPQLFFSSSSQALPVLAGLSIFKVSGSVMVYYLAGLHSVPSSLYEAAFIDGAGSWRRFWNITFPLLRPIHFYVAILATIGSFQIFDSAFLITNGGPGYSTTTLVFYLYQEGFAALRFSYASVLAYVLFVMVLIVSLIQRKFLGKEVSYH